MTEKKPQWPSLKICLMIRIFPFIPLIDLYVLDIFLSPDGITVLIIWICHSFSRCLPYKLTGIPEVSGWKTGLKLSGPKQVMDVALRMTCLGDLSSTKGVAAVQMGQAGGCLNETITETSLPVSMNPQNDFPLILSVWKGHLHPFLPGAECIVYKYALFCHNWNAGFLKKPDFI